MQHRYILAIAIFCTLMFGCAGKDKSKRNNRGAVKPEPSQFRLVEAYRIGVDDIVEVNVWRNPDLSVKVPVRPDGKISVPLVGDITAGGLTPERVAQEIKKKLSTFIRDPQVAVILTELRSHEFLSRIRITGAVKNPKSIPYRQGMTVLDAILEAGGANEFAAPNSAKMFRKLKNSRVSVKEIELDDILKKGKMDTNYTLQPGDVITVPERFF